MNARVSAGTLAALILGLGLCATAATAQTRVRSDEGAGHDREPERNRAPERMREPERGREPDRGPGQERVRPPHDDWSLGASVEILEVGVRVRDVYPGSAAQRAGLERGDVVVTVGGYQVGSVEGRVFDLDEEVQRRADRSGTVRLLVQDRRDSRLKNLDVRLGASGDGRNRVGGEVSFRGAPLPRGAELRVRLVRKVLFGRETVAEMSAPIAGGNVFPFELRFDPRQVDVRRDYEVEAEVWANGRRLYVQDGTYRVRLDPPPAPVRIELRRD